MPPPAPNDGTTTNNPTSSNNGRRVGRILSNMTGETIVPDRLATSSTGTVPSLARLCTRLLAHIAISELSQSAEARTLLEQLRNQPALDVIEEIHDRGKACRSLAPLSTPLDDRAMKTIMPRWNTYTPSQLAACHQNFFSTHTISHSDMDIFKPLWKLLPPSCAFVDFARESGHVRRRNAQKELQDEQLRSRVFQEAEEQHAEAQRKHEEYYLRRQKQHRTTVGGGDASARVDITRTAGTNTTTTTAAVNNQMATEEDEPAPTPAPAPARNGGGGHGATAHQGRSTDVGQGAGSEQWPVGIVQRTRNSRLSAEESASPSRPASASASIAAGTTSSRRRAMSAQAGDPYAPPPSPSPTRATVTPATVTVVTTTAPRRATHAPAGNALSRSSQAEVPVAGATRQRMVCDGDYGYGYDDDDDYYDDDDDEYYDDDDDDDDDDCDSRDGDGRSGRDGDGSDEDDGPVFQLIGASAESCRDEEALAVLCRALAYDDACRQGFRTKHRRAMQAGLSASMSASTTASTATPVTPGELADGGDGGAVDNGDNASGRGGNTAMDATPDRPDDDDDDDDDDGDGGDGDGDDDDDDDGRGGNAGDASGVSEHEGHHGTASAGRMTASRGGPSATATAAASSSSAGRARTVSSGSGGKRSGACRHDDDYRTDTGDRVDTAADAVMHDHGRGDGAVATAATAAAAAHDDDDGDDDDGDGDDQGGVGRRGEEGGSDTSRLAAQLETTTLPVKIRKTVGSGRAPSRPQPQHQQVQQPQQQSQAQQPQQPQQPQAQQQPQQQPQQSQAQQQPQQQPEQLQASEATAERVQAHEHVDDVIVWWDGVDMRTTIYPSERRVRTLLKGRRYSFTERQVFSEVHLHYCKDLKRQGLSALVDHPIIAFSFTHARLSTTFFYRATLNWSESLGYLDITSCGGVRNDQIYHAIANLHALRVLNISDTKIRALPPLRRLEVLHAEGTRLNTQEVITLAQHSRYLRELYVQLTDVGVDVISALCIMPNLEALGLAAAPGFSIHTQGTVFDAAHATRVHNFFDRHIFDLSTKKLRWLDVSFTSAPVGFVQRVAERFPTLEYLGVFGTAAQDAVPAAIPRPLTVGCSTRTRAEVTTAYLQTPLCMPSIELQALLRAVYVVLPRNGDREEMRGATHDPLLQRLVDTLWYRMEDTPLVLVITAVLYYVLLHRDPERHLARVRRDALCALKRTLCVHSNEEQIVKNICLSLQNFEVWSELSEFALELASTLTGAAETFTDNTIRSFALLIVSREIATLSHPIRLKLVGQEDIMNRMLVLIDSTIQRLPEQNRDLLLQQVQHCWLFMWNITDESPAICRLALADPDCIRLLRVTMQADWAGQPTVHNIMGFLANVSEVPELRPRFFELNLVSLIVDAITRHTGQGLAVTYNATGIICHLATHVTLWEGHDPSLETALEAVRTCIDEWSITTSSQINYRGNAVPFSVGRKIDFKGGNPKVSVLQKR
ncbi:hypothetical protein PTSG_12591 [Salpingoeca rosetta]|uniref:Protein zer-1 homolog-like C-terminal domain-containing protein n=1 Tax=Salpingoeca rosetta (strain ATCC 50818 / BSB-021) TaxID=946362 RepID=F2UIU1_SALR5|nr:uncharacterized protein PTSG_12591 [Salpingoeca rosetta]EGD77140.1 hypothetical protein PTSG_12591 [Salpingoeca rosetta]|eukprot:XP_004990979.1 hypothetical protein PTSG_12591 [Salpingoeca rosetta]